MMKDAAAAKSFDVKRAGKQTKQRLESMTVKERTQSLVKAGILTKSGRVSKPYSKVIQ